MKKGAMVCLHERESEGLETGLNFCILFNLNSISIRISDSCVTSLHAVELWFIRIAGIFIHTRLLIISVGGRFITL